MLRKQSLPQSRLVCRVHLPTAGAFDCLGVSRYPSFCLEHPRERPPSAKYMSTCHHVSCPHLLLRSRNINFIEAYCLCTAKQRTRSMRSFLRPTLLDLKAPEPHQENVPSRQSFTYNDIILQHTFQEFSAQSTKAAVPVSVFSRFRVFKKGKLGLVASTWDSFQPCCTYLLMGCQKKIKFLQVAFSRDRAVQVVNNLICID